MIGAGVGVCAWAFVPRKRRLQARVKGGRQKPLKNEGIFLATPLPRTAIHVGGASSALPAAPRVPVFSPCSFSTLP